MIDGETIKVGGEDKVLPPLNWKGCKKFFGAIAEGGLSLVTGAETMVEMVHTALVRNYPELTIDQLEENASPGEIMTAIPVLLRLSGFVQGETPGGSVESPIGTA